MSSELLYTSAPQGLKGGSRGFTTVLCTAGMPPNLADKLESFSGYKHIYSPQDPLAEYNPVRYAYLRPSVGGRSVVVVSRLAAYGVDYSGRSNKLAHHIVLDGNERPAGGPAWLLSQHYIWKAVWDGECKTLASGPQIPMGSKSADVCRQWHEVTGDAGWGGQLVTWLKESSKPVWLIYDPKQQEYILELLVEALALLPEAERWKCTFATYFPGLPSDVDCRIRGVVVGSDEARLASARGYVIDLNRSLPLAATSVWIEAARTGIAPSASAALSAVSVLPSERFDLRESPPQAEFGFVEAPWPNESKPVNGPGLPDDVPPKISDYQIAPPPMPSRRHLAEPPAITGHQKAADSSRSVLRMALLVVAVAVLLSIMGVGYWFFGNPVTVNSVLPDVVLGAVDKKDSKDEVGAETKTPAEPAAVGTESQEMPSESSGTTKRGLPGAPLQEITLVCSDVKPELVQTWSKESRAAFKVTIPENWKGVTNYKLIVPSDFKAMIDPHDSFLAIGDEGEIVVCNEQDYESSAWENNPKHLAILVKLAEEQFRISLEVKLTNETRIVSAKDIEVQMDVSANRELQIDVPEKYEGSLGEVEVFGFDLIPAMEENRESVGKYGKIVRKGEAFVYKLELEKVSLVDKADSEEVFDYEVSSGRGDSPSRARIIIRIHNPYHFNWLIAKTVDGSDLRFEKEVIRNLFKSRGKYEISFKNNDLSTSNSVFLEMIEQGGKILLKSDRDLAMEGVGRFTLDPFSKDKNKIELFDSTPLRTNLESLCIESFLFRSICEKQIAEEIASKNKEIMNLEVSIKTAQLPAEKKQLDDELEKLRIEKRSVESLRNRVGELVKNRKGVRDVRSLEDLLNANAEVLVNELVDGMEAKSSSQLAVLERCRAETLRRFNEARVFVKSCTLIVVKLGEDSAAASRENLNATSKEIPNPPAR